MLNPDGKDWIPFSEFVAGMIIVKRDPELCDIIPVRTHAISQNYVYTSHFGV